MKAAIQGNASAQNSVGVLYRDGKGVPKCSWTTKEWVFRASDQGLVDAQLNMGMMYRHVGAGSKAVEWVMKAADQENATAQFNIGALYYDGCGVPQDLHKAMGWYLRPPTKDTQ